jgi:hypothetical protein
MPAVTSQGNSFGGYPCTNVRHKWSRPDPTSSKLEASTLSLAHGSERVYVEGLPDPGPGGVNGITYTVTIAFISESAPEVGSGSGGMICTESETEHAVGELVKGTATFVSVPS